MNATIDDVRDLLALAARSGRDRGILSYYSGDTTSFQTLKYTELYDTAKSNAKLLKRIEGFKKDSIILLHFKDHLDNIIWLWSVLYAGCIPAMSTPFVNQPEHRDKHILHLHQLLDNPLCLTRLNLLGQFPAEPILRLHTVDSLELQEITDSNLLDEIPKSAPSDLALLMLTSGSTGNAKAVRLSHEQISTSVAGKSAYLTLQQPSPYAFLNCKC
jgi:acyl-CoA synthetase (AMP-forming)/AMP-acid ligase II